MRWRARLASFRLRPTDQSPESRTVSRFRPNNSYLSTSRYPTFYRRIISLVPVPDILISSPLLLSLEIRWKWNGETNGRWWRNIYEIAQSNISPFFIILIFLYKIFLKSLVIAKNKKFVLILFHSFHRFSKDVPYFYRYIARRRKVSVVARTVYLYYLRR